MPNTITIIIKHHHHHHHYYLSYLFLFWLTKSTERSGSKRVETGRKHAYTSHVRRETTIPSKLRKLESQTEQVSIRKIISQSLQ